MAQQENAPPGCSKDCPVSRSTEGVLSRVAEGLSDVRPLRGEMNRTCRKTLRQGVLALIILASVSEFTIPRLAQADPSRMGQEAAPAHQTDEKRCGQRRNEYSNLRVPSGVHC